MVNGQQNCEGHLWRRFSSFSLRRDSLPRNYGQKLLLCIEEEEVPTVVMMDNSATNTGESTQPMLGGKEEAHYIENKTTSSARKKMEGVYSEENVKKRTSADGCVKPVTAPKLLPDGSYARPSGRQRKGCNWDGVRGVWVPSETYAQSVMYLAWLDFPPDFLETMAQFAGLKALAVGLGATKIGASKSMPDFHNKTQTMRGYFSFATLRYMPFVVPANIDFDAFDAEKAFHYIFHGQLLSGEWYNLSVDEKELIQNRLIGLGCLYSGPIDMEFTSRKSVAPRNDPKGYVYFASLDLDRHVSQAINSFIDDSNTPVQWSKIFDNLRAVKIGCSTLLQHGDEFFNEEEEDYDYDNKKEGISPRGGPYVWALSHIAPMKYSAYECDGMFHEESSQHDNYDYAWICGEWYVLSGGEIEYECSMDGRHSINGRWVRKKRGGVSNIDAITLTKWTNTKLVMVEDLQRRMDKGTTKSVV